MNLLRFAVLASPLLVLTGCNTPPPPDLSAAAPLGTAASAQSDPPTCTTVPRTDVMILSSTPDTNESGLSGVMFFTGTTKGGNPGYTLMRFDVGSIPGGAQITSATVTVTPSATRGVGTVDAHDVLGGWNPAIVTWNNFSAGFDPVPAASFAIGSAPWDAGAITSGLAPASFDLTALVQQWVNGLANNGILLEQSLVEPSASYTYYDDSAAAAPALHVCYTGGSQGNPCQGVTCTASDACHAAGVCDPATGACSNPPAADGTACNDGNACTTGDACQAGVCTGAPVTCAASDPCHAAGICDPATGVCSNPAQPNGTACNDGNACTTGDSCQAGVCTGAPVTCTASDQCHAAGVCNPATGACSNPPVANGTACNDGNACTTGDSCQAGVCTGAPVTCTASDQCHAAGVCNPATGVCSNPTVANGTACNDGNACTTNDVCLAGVCAGSPVVCAASDGCHTAGSCDPTTGACSSSSVSPDGSACSTGNACVEGETCLGGACQGGSALAGCDACATGPDSDGDGLSDFCDVYPDDPIQAAKYGAALDWLLTHQSPDGSWGPDAYRPQASCAAVATLRRIGERRPQFWLGYGYVLDANPLNNDEKACALTALGDFPAADRIAGDLAQAARVPSAGQDANAGSILVDVPGTGWGLAPAYAPDPFASSLVMKSFHDAGAYAGQSEVSFTQAVAPGGSYTTTIDVPAGARSFSAGLVGSFAGNLDLYVKRGSPAGPGSFDYASTSQQVYDFVSVSGGVPAGTYYVTAHNPDPTHASAGYLAVAYGTAGVDASAVTGGLLYLVGTQKDDGSWGVGPFDAGEPRASCETLETLARYGQGSLTELGAGMAWLLAQQQPNGSFGTIPATASCHMMMTFAGGVGASMRAAYDHIVGAQLADGSYGEDPFATAVALEVLSQRRRMP